MRVVDGEFLAGVAAQQQALKSAETQLASPKLGLEVGVRTNLDVLNAQQAYFAVMNDLIRTRYQILFSDLDLAAASGAMNEQRLNRVNLFLMQ